MSRSSKRRKGAKPDKGTLIRKRKAAQTTRRIRELSQALRAAKQARIEAALLDASVELPAGAYRSLEEARSAARGAGSGFASGLAIGLAAVSVVGLGIVICYLLFRRKDGLAAPVVIQREIVREVLNPEIVRVDPEPPKPDPRPAYLEHVDELERAALERARRGRS